MHILIFGKQSINRLFRRIAHILIPLSHSLSGIVAQVQFGIAHLGIIRNQREEVFKIARLVDSHDLVRIFYHDQHIPYTFLFVIKLEQFTVQIRHARTSCIVIVHFAEVVVYSEHHILLISQQAPELIRHVTVLHQVIIRISIFILHAEYIHERIVHILYRSLRVIYRFTDRDVDEDILKQFVTASGLYLSFDSLRNIYQEFHYLIISRHVCYAVAEFLVSHLFSAQHIVRVIYHLFEERDAVVQIRFIVYLRGQSTYITYLHVVDTPSGVISFPYDIVHYFPLTVSYQFQSSVCDRHIFHHLLLVPFFLGPLGLGAVDVHTDADNIRGRHKPHIVIIRPSSIFLYRQETDRAPHLFIVNER